MTSTVKSEWQMACPKCGDDRRIDITAQVAVRLCRDGTDVAGADNGDHEWNDKSPALCAACGHTATVKDFAVATSNPQIADNDARARRAADAVYGYVKSKGEAYEESSSEVVDLITDLLHLAVKLDQGDDPADSTLRLAQMHFEAETAEDAS